MQYIEGCFKRNGATGKKNFITQRRGAAEREELNHEEYFVFGKRQAVKLVKFIVDKLPH